MLDAALWPMHPGTGREHGAGDWQRCIQACQPSGCNLLISTPIERPQWLKTSFTEFFLHPGALNMGPQLSHVTEPEVRARGALGEAVSVASAIQPRQSLLNKVPLRRD